MANTPMTCSLRERAGTSNICTSVRSVVADLCLDSFAAAIFQNYDMTEYFWI